MDEQAAQRLRSVLESLLCAHGEPLSVDRAVDVIGDATRAEVVEALRALALEYERERRGFRVAEVGGGYQLRTAPEHAETVRRLFRERPFRLTRAMLETLAIVAYRQLVTKAEIEAIRGVDVDSALGTLLERRLIRVAGRKDAVGRPLLYGTSPEFLEVFGLTNLRELPVLKELGDIEVRGQTQIDLRPGAASDEENGAPGAQVPDALRFDAQRADPEGQHDEQVRGDEASPDRPPSQGAPEAGEPPPHHTSDQALPPNPDASDGKD